MDNNLEKFLLDDNRNDELFMHDLYNYKFHKEKINDRFIVIYYREIKNIIYQSDYKIAAYFDVKDKCLYEQQYVRLDYLLDNNEIKVNSFYDLNNEIIKKVNKTISKYINNNKKELANYGEKQYAELADYRLKVLKRETMSKYITEDNPKIDFAADYEHNFFQNYKCFIDGKIYYDYLENPEKTINELAERIINDDKEKIGLMILEKEQQCKYLEEILKNNNNEYDNLILNKKIYTSLKNVYCDSVNVTLNYNGNEITFRANTNDLKKNIESGLSKITFYNKSYKHVIEFLRNNTEPVSYGYYDSCFDISRIASITYGKKELYRKELESKNINKKTKNKEMER